MKKTENKKRCNCRVKKECPLNGDCQQSAVVYKATLHTEDEKKEKHIYIGLPELTFKDRYDQHTYTFRTLGKRKATELSKKVWELKDAQIPHKITWEVIQRGHPYRGGAKTCDLCLTEKLLILTNKDKNMLNTRRELISKCRHRNKFGLNTKELRA